MVEVNPAQIEQAMEIARAYWWRAKAKYPPRRFEPEDLLSAAYLGALKAVRTYDAGRAPHFSTWCVQQVEFAMREEVRRQDWLPRRLRARAMEEWRRTEQEPEWARPPASFEAVAFRDEDGEEDAIRLLALLTDTEADTEAEALERVERSHLRAVVDGLPPRQRELVRRYFWGAETLREIGVALGISETRVHQLRDDAFLRLRRALEPDSVPARPCAVCGRPFRHYASARTRTCSPECRGAAVARAKARPRQVRAGQ